MKACMWKMQVVGYTEKLLGISWILRSKNSQDLMECLTAIKLLELQETSLKHLRTLWKELSRIFMFFYMLA